jgi:hypothetical protein
MKLINVVKKSLCTYPTLYLFSTFESSQIRILDHYFGTLGGGVRWAHTKNPNKGGYMCEPNHIKKKGEWVRTYDKNYGEETIDINLESYFKEPVVNVATYFNFKRLFVGTFSEFERQPNRQEWESSCIVLHGSKKIFTPDAKYLINYNVIEANEEYLNSFYNNYFELDCWRPYPNFEKEYSPFWKPGVEYIQEDWRYGALWWLAECKKYFNSNRIMNYFYYPSEKNIEDFTEVLKRFLNEGRSIEQINKDYRLECFNGTNFEDFAYDKWDKELNKILTFIEETTYRLLTI